MIPTFTQQILIAFIDHNDTLTGLNNPINPITPGNQELHLGDTIFSLRLPARADWKLPTVLSYSLIDRSAWYSSGASNV